MSEHIHKRHNKSLLLYHLVCPIKYRRKVLSDEVTMTFREVCIELSERYEVHFLEIRVRRRSRSFFDSKYPDVVSKKDCQHNKKHHSTRGFQITS